MPHGEVPVGLALRFLVLRFGTSALFQLYCGFSPLASTEQKGPS